MYEDIRVYKFKDIGGEKAFGFETSNNFEMFTDVSRKRHLYISSSDLVNNELTWILKHFYCMQFFLTEPE